MITSLRLVNFKNFADETLRVGPFTVIVGENASGKSNIRDAFRFLHGIGRGYTLAEIFGGKHGDGGYVEWTGIRGAPNEVARFRPLYPNQLSTFAIQVKVKLGQERFCYFIKIGFDPTSGFVLLEEELRKASDTIFAGVGIEGRVIKVVAEQFGTNQLIYGRSAPLIQHFGTRHELMEIFNTCEPLLKLFGGMRFMELTPEIIREPSIPGSSAIGDSGENLPTALEAICSDPARKATLMSWLQELTPMDVDDFAFPRDPSGKLHLHVHERSGRTVSANSVSDGTLRFLAMLAVLLGNSPTGIYFFEEIDTGIHPNRLWLLVDLIEKQTAKGGIQVITTTHSPDMLNFINDKTFESMSVVSRLDDTDDAIIRSVDSLPKAKKLRESYGLGRLHSTAWMETTLAFTEGYNDEDQAE